MRQDLVGRTLKGRYRIEGLLGQGGMAAVYKAWDSKRLYHVAIKVLREDLAEDREFDRRFRREAEALARLAHRNIVRFYSFERAGHLAFIVMDYVEGATLRRRIFDANGPLPTSKVLSITKQVVAALTYAHQQGILHRDVKPGNIMIESTGQVLVADFGIAKATDAATITTVMPGTPAYMSPEQCRSEPLDTRTDVYSLGVLAYEMLTGRRPFVGDTSATTGSTREKIRWEQMHANPAPLRKLNPQVSPGVEASVLKALAKERENRWTTPLAFWEALSSSMGTRPETGSAEPAMPQGTDPVLALDVPSGNQASAESAKVVETRTKPRTAAPDTKLVPFLQGLPVWAWVLVVVAIVVLLIVGLGPALMNRSTPVPVVVERVVTATPSSPLDRTSPTVSQSGPTASGTTLTPEGMALPTTPTAGAMAAASPSSVPTAMATKTLPPPTTTATATRPPTPTRTLTPTETATRGGSPQIGPDNLGELDLLHVMQGHDKTISGLAFSPDSALLASTDWERPAVQLWRTKDGSLVRTLTCDLEGAFDDVDFSPDGRLLAAGGDAVPLWNVEDGSLWKILEWRAEFEAMGWRNVEFNPEGDILAASVPDLTLWLYDTSDGSVVTRFDTKAPVFGLAFSPDGEKVATSQLANTVRIWSAKDGRLERELVMLGDVLHDMEGVAFSPDGSIVASLATWANAVHLWEYRSGSLLHTLALPEYALPTSLAFSPDGSILAAGCRDGAIRFWRVSSGQLVHTQESDTSQFRISFSPNGRWLASGTTDGEVCIWGIP